jgi:hypothetical protein
MRRHRPERNPHSPSRPTPPPISRRRSLLSSRRQSHPHQSHPHPHAVILRLSDEDRRGALTASSCRKKNPQSKLRLKLSGVLSPFLPLCPLCSSVRELRITFPLLFSANLRALSVSA